MKNWIANEMLTEAEQKMMCQPTPEFDGIEIYFSELDGSNQTSPFYLTEKELPIFIERISSMMNHVIKSKI